MTAAGRIREILEPETGAGQPVTAEVRVTMLVPGYGEIGCSGGFLARAAVAAAGKTDSALRREAGTGSDGEPLPGTGLAGLARKDLVRVIAGQATARGDAARERAAQEAAAYAVAAADRAGDGSTVYGVRADVPGFEPLYLLVRAGPDGKVREACDDGGTPVTGPRLGKAVAAVAGWRAAAGDPAARQIAAGRKLGEAEIAGTGRGRYIRAAASALHTGGCRIRGGGHAVYAGGPGALRETPAGARKNAGTTIMDRLRPGSRPLSRSRWPASRESGSSPPPREPAGHVCDAPGTCAAGRETVPAFSPAAGNGKSIHS